MVKDWPKLAAEWGASLAQLRAGIPDVMKGFGQIDAAAYKDGALDAKTKELIAMALGVASRCDGCIAFHAKAAVKYGATREELQECLAMTVMMGGGPSVMYAALALEAFDQWKAQAKA